MVQIVLVVGLATLLISQPKPVQAQWPPFNFRLTPSYDAETGLITYDLFFGSQLEGAMTDITINIPLPVGTQFLEAQAQPSTEVSFDGQEVKFFTAMLPRNKSIKVASFVVEPTDPAQTVFTTQPWLAWQGDLPGDYLNKEVSVDITKIPLVWAAPSRSRLRLEAWAEVIDDEITYTIYPANIGGRMWDVTVKLPLPEGTTFLSAEPAHPFEADFDGQAVTFFTSELARSSKANPLQVKVSTEGITAPGLVTHAWATWKNVGRSVGRRIPLQEDTRTGDIVVQPHVSQWVMADIIGDVPFAAYDITSLALREEDEALTITFYTIGQLEPVGEPFTFFFNIDNCAGQAKYQAAYSHKSGKAILRSWNEETDKWNPRQPVEFANPGPRQLIIRIPYDLFEDNQHGRDFCGQAKAQYKTDIFSSRPRTETAPNTNDQRLTHYQAVTTSTTVTATPAQPNQPAEQSAANAQTPLDPATDISGQLAVPLDNGQVAYDVHIFSLPQGQTVAHIPNARQPDFRYDGQRLVVNREGSGLENLYEVTLADGSEQPVSAGADDAHPFYDLYGNRITYGNSNLIIDERIFVQCSLLLPHQEVEPYCQDVVGFGMLISAGHGQLQGTHPVWTANDMIAYRGCNTWAGSGKCGIYLVPAASTRGFSDGLNPRQLTQEPDDTPSDTWGNWIAFTSGRDGNWEAYVMDLAGNNVKNLSNSPLSNDGLPTISPDGHWVAFVSDRDGPWAVWVSPINGGEVTKLFDLPTTPWGDGERVWLNERLSWGGNGSERPVTIAPEPAVDYFQRYPTTTEP